MSRPLVGPSSKTIDALVQRALQEDIGSGDLTSTLIPEDSRSEAQVITREQAVLCGIPWVNSVFRQLDTQVTIQWRVADGDDITPGIKVDMAHIIMTSGSEPMRPLKLLCDRSAIDQNKN